MCKVAALRESNSILPLPTYGYFHNSFNPVNIDNINDLLLAEIQIKANINKENNK